MPASATIGTLGTIVVHWHLEDGHWRLDGIDLPPAELPEAVVDHPQALALLERLRDPSRRSGGVEAREAAAASWPTGFAGEVARLLATFVPAGRVVAYGTLAAWAGSPGAARAVGGAMRRNPLPLLIPCHRVVAADGRLGGFQGGAEGALARKRALLEEEGVPFAGPARVAAEALMRDRPVGG